MKSFRTTFVQPEYILTAFILLLAFSLRIWGISARSLWFDEVFKIWPATSNFWNIPQLRGGIIDPPLYSYLLHFWMQFGKSEVHLRSLSVFFSVLSVIGVMVLGYRIQGWATSLIAGVLMALIPTEVRYAQEVGPYALMVCLIVWNVVALLNIKKNPKWIAYCLWAFLAILGTYSHYGAALTIVFLYCIFLIEVIYQKDWHNLKYGVVTFVFYWVAITPLLLYLLPTQIPWALSFGAPLNEFVSLSSELKNIWVFTQQFVAFQFTGWPFTVIPPILPFFLVVILLIISGKNQSRFLSWLLLTLGVYYLASRIGLFNYPRHGLILSPLIVPIVAYGLQYLVFGSHRKYQNLLGLLILISLVVIIFISLPNRSFRDRLFYEQNWLWPETEDMRPVVEYWQDRRDKTIPTYIYYGATPAFTFYTDTYKNKGPDLQPLQYSKCWGEQSPEYCRRDGIYYGKWIRSLTPEEKIQSIYKTISGRPEELWIIFSHHLHVDEENQILAGLLDHYSIIQSFQKTNASVYLLKTKSY